MEYTLIFIFSEDMSRVLLQNKNRGPYPGKLNGIGGKITEEDHRSNEYTPFVCAYREIQEETGLTRDDMEKLTYICYHRTSTDTVLNVLYAKLLPGKTADQIEDEILEWWDVDSIDFTDLTYFADLLVPYFIDLAVTNNKRSSNPV